MTRLWRGVLAVCYGVAVGAATLAGVSIGTGLPAGAAYGLGVVAALLVAAAVLLLTAGNAPVGTYPPERPARASERTTGPPSGWGHACNPDGSACEACEREVADMAERWETLR